MRSVKELRAKCQAGKEGSDTWYGRCFARKISIYFTIAFIKLGIRANVVTGMFLLSGIVAACLFAIGTKESILAGALMLQLWYILDHSDGEVARNNNETSLTGIYYDYIIHYIVHPMVFFGIGFGVSRAIGNVNYLFLGVAGAFAIMLLSLVSDLKDMVLFRAHIAYSGDEGVKGSGKGERSFGRKIFSGGHLLCTFPVIMNLITIAAIVDFVFNKYVMLYVLASYAVLINIVWIMKVIVFILGKKMDHEG